MEEGKWTISREENGLVEMSDLFGVSVSVCVSKRDELSSVGAVNKLLQSI